MHVSSPWGVASSLVVLALVGCSGSPGGDGDVGTSSSAIGVSSGEKTAYDFFVAKGLKNYQAAGIVGNLQQESSLDPTVYQYGGGPGRGIAQWSAGGRWDTDAHDNVVWYAHEQGASEWSLDLQLEFIWYELTTFSGYGLSPLRGSADVTGATIAFEDDFEVCGDCEQSSRIDYAEAVLAAFGKTDPTGGAPSPTVPDETAHPVAVNSDGRLEAFSRDASGSAAHDWQTTAGGAWSGWSTLGGDFSTDPVTVSNADGRLETFALDTNGSIVHEWQTSAGGAWSGRSSLGGTAISNVALARDADGRLEAFVLGTDHAVWHAWQKSAGGSWSDWSSLGGNDTGTVGIAVNRDGRLEVFVEGASDHEVWHAWQQSAGGAWSDWASLGGGDGSPTVARNADGRLEVFVRDAGGHVDHAWQTSAGGGWSGWSSLGGDDTGEVAVASNADGRLEIFVAGASSHAAWHAWQTSAGGAWSDWAELGGDYAGAIAVAVNHDGRLELFGRTTDGALDHQWQTTAGGGWSGVSSLGGSLE